MKEIVYLQKNIQKWNNIHNATLYAKSADPDDLADMYLDLTSDLAFSQTNYPGSSTTENLNNMAFQLHGKIYRKKSNMFSRIGAFASESLPKVMYERRHTLAFTFVLFAVFVLLGVLAELNDPNHLSQIAGQEYVDQTIENIEKGEPTAIYGSMGEGTSFFAITTNNLIVDLMTFVLGIFTCIGTIFYMIFNAVMMGSFQAFFFNYGVGGESMLSIWQHGALEIPTVILAGTAGITLGSGWLFPKTYSRLQAFKHSAKSGLKIMFGVFPITVVAGFIEAFITRHTEFPDILRITAIVLEFAFIIWYFVIFPYLKFHHREPSDV